MKRASELAISNDTLFKLNKNIKRTIKEKKESNIDFDFLERVYGMILRNKSYLREGKIKCIISIKKTEMVKIALDFFESINQKLYEKARDVILNIDERASIDIVNVNINGMKGREGNVRTVMGKSRVYVPTQIELSSKEALESEMCTIEDLYTLVHEISHLFDLNFEDSLPNREELIGQEKNNNKKITRELFGESTAISFEHLLTEYLMRETDYSNEAIKQSYNRRMNDLYDMTSSIYCRLLLVKESEKSGEITQDMLKTFIKNNGLSISYFRHMVDKIIRDSHSLTYRNRYVVAGAISPTIVERYHKHGIETLDKYLDAVKNDDLKEVLSVLDISLDNKGIKQVIGNLLQQDANINRILFSTHEIGKNVSGTLISEKEKAQKEIMKDIQRKEKQTNDEKNR